MHNLNSSILKPQLNVVYTYNGTEVSQYPPMLPHKFSKLPYVLMNVWTSPTTKYTVYSLVDTGCSSSMLSSNFVDKFPERLKYEIEPLDLVLGMASLDSVSKITGKIDLLVSIKSHPLDDVPLRFVHTFLIGTNLSKDMFLGYDFLGNEHALVSLKSDYMTWHYPPAYQFPKDPYDISSFKLIPFVFFNSEEASASNNFQLNLEPMEVGMVYCRLSQDMRGKTVKIDNFSSYTHYSTTPLAQDNMPYVTPDIAVVDRENCVPVEIQNLDSNTISLEVDSPIAFISLVEDETNPNVNTVVEINSMENKLRQFSNNDLLPDMGVMPISVDNEFLSTQANSSLLPSSSKSLESYTDFLNKDPFIADMPPTLPYDPKPKQNQKKSDFTEQQFLDMFDFSDLSEEMKSKFVPLLIKYREAFSHFPLDIRKCNTYTHKIEIIGTPTLPKQRFLADNVREAVVDQVEGYLSVNVMDNKSPRKHFSNFVPIIKPDGRVRLCIDMIFINRNIRSDNKVVLMGSPTHLIHRFQHAKKALTADLHQAYPHLPIDSHCALYYGIYSPISVQENLGFSRVIQGEKTAVYGYNKASNNTYSDMHSFLLNWIDDYCIFADTDEQLLENFEKFLKRTKTSGLSLSPSKLNFGTKRFQFLGEEFDRITGCRTIPQAKVQGILALKAPITLKSLRSFLGILKFYNGHLPGIAVAAMPLQMALRDVKNNKFKWTSQMQQSFIDTKLAICESVALYDPYPDGIFKLYTLRKGFILTTVPGLVKLI